LAEPSETDILLQRIKSAIANDARLQLRHYNIPENKDTLRSVLIGFVIAQHVLLERFDEVIMDLGIVLPQPAIVKKRINDAFKEMLRE